jgi:tRNA threonylcarbamoyladenosine biosynthesis protein TsaB
VEREITELRVLTIDTATPVETVAVVEDGREIARRTTRAGRGRADEFAAAVADALADAATSLSDLSALVVSIGPGRFTGLRVGLATAKGLAASTRLPIVAVPTLEALAESSLPGEGSAAFVCPMLDARRGEVYAALFRADGALTRVHPDVAVDPADFAALVARKSAGDRVIVAGTGAPMCEDEFRRALGGALDPVLGPAVPRPVALAALARRIEPSDPASLSPVYLRGV